MIGVERTRGTGVCLEVDEEFDDLVFADAIIESDPQLAAKWLMGAERAAIATEIKLRVRVSSCCVRDQLSPKV